MVVQELIETKPVDGFKTFKAKDEPVLDAQQKEPEEAINIDLQLKLFNLKQKKYKFQGGK